MDRRKFLAAGAMAAASNIINSRLWAAEAGDDALVASVHPELRQLARQMLPMFRSQPAPTLESLPAMRSQSMSYAKKPAADIPYEKREIAGAAGQPPVTLYLINAGKGEGRPAILYTHGGGFIAGSAASYIEPLQALCRELGCVAVAVEYRLAPETTYRGSIEDNYAGLKWLHDNAASLGVDPARIAVMGESAGGGHAALLAIAARDRGEVPVAFQCLIYPMLDDRTGSSRDVPPNVGRFIWTPQSNRFGWQCFLGEKPGTVHISSAAVPARVTNLTGLPPAFIGVGSIDLFVDEDIEYARRLNDSGVSTELIVVPGAFHGFDILPIPSQIGQRFAAAKLIALKRGLGIT
ncbi:MAG TPA: alpha/beta hydrolase [Sphingobium sp.]|uniref:alpha/beta hydrolase n=1 Tax=Sphingobium sp. TaxID=1912891 RepID=UPI002ED4657D